jgi:amino acid adenylation domain-containing protein
MTYLLHHLLSESAKRHPEKEAIRFNGEGMTYAQLDHLTDRVATTLQNAGVRRGDRIAIYVSKSFSSVVAIFGILKAGGVYVPLDPNAPPKRLAYITRNCNVNVILISESKLTNLADFFGEGTPLKTVIVMEPHANEKEEPLPEYIQVIPWDQVIDGKANPPEETATIETDLAYILYTSGSTGDPKGVMISHSTIFTFINWCYEKFNISSEDRVTSHAPLHFDLSTFDIYVTIKAGGTIVLIPEKLSIFPIQLVKLLQDERITVTYLVPSILSLMVNYGSLENHDLSNLRMILFAGEVFPIKYLRKLVAAIPHAEYFNLYGPTETNVCTYYQVQPKDLSPEITQPVPIGKACENIEVFAVDDQGKMVTEPGNEGELWVRGSCIAQGYWGDPEKTTRNFVRNPYQTAFDEIAYRTGDIVTLDEDGINWIFIGRRDHMIKSRGYRIEIGEIESALYNHKGLKEVAVVAIPDDLLGSRLKAYIVPLEENGVSETDVKDHCRQYLPGYMIPESIVMIGELPKTSTGKVDRPSLIKRI